MKPYTGKGVMTGNGFRSPKGNSSRFSHNHPNCGWYCL